MAHTLCGREIFPKVRCSVARMKWDDAIRWSIFSPVVVCLRTSSGSWDFARVPALLAQGSGFFSQAQARLKVRGPTQQQGQSTPTGPAASALAEAANQAKGVQWLQWARLPSAAATAGTMALGGTRLGAGCWLAGDRATSPAAPPRGSMGPWDLLRPASDWLQTGFRLGSGRVQTGLARWGSWSATGP
ncbi:hypothetical protein HCBG_00617 [Histoplasma capsulatum G186AR]|uniref:Uncharacterized protein n=1 Tax=Ajellomyces capsulatus (strain G186AR / H82 / ATCC MYA-2454 / RMSCC 2432) TaxID=447093 RepID=C0NBX1_AJECG|nr:uncharacterized protein HCBG_00617 [Histoplasma capsulatum G186AR]EEH11162.1 hypothetical protein HCBG_00617 [Histoplasma capsulatum G186AR]